jgi:hypothetical protein
MRGRKTDDAPQRGPTPVVDAIVPLFGVPLLDETVEVFDLLPCARPGRNVRSSQLASPYPNVVQNFPERCPERRTQPDANYVI